MTRRIHLKHKGRTAGCRLPAIVVSGINGGGLPPWFGPFLLKCEYFLPRHPCHELTMKVLYLGNPVIQLLVIQLLALAEIISLQSHHFASGPQDLAPFDGAEAGFGEQQKGIIESWGCSDASVVYDSEGGKARQGGLWLLCLGSLGVIIAMAALES